MPTIRAHKSPTTGILIPIRSQAVSTPPCCSPPKLLQFNSFEPLSLPEPGIPTNPPSRKLGHQNLIPEKSNQKHKNTIYTLSSQPAPIFPLSNRFKETLKFQTKSTNLIPQIENPNTNSTLQIGY
ncbi:hypothetical protein CFOL_v3_18154 [Cephalotus follicularis]|uniref:Uncharacterized protein n=1 Tax=Cephalotus follicularis TaxID=3775 RepID=A0A1Q3C356_CEPFO|nr:hypothetical protein CFOL_v3_18154 [Cephalotus follicularis]